MKKCVFFDRDGIVNEPPGEERYVTEWEKFRLIPEFVECAAVAADKGYATVIITNQSAIAKGLMTTEYLDSMHNRLKKILADSHGINLLDILYCPHNPGECNCRKPEPGMFYKAAEKHDIDLATSWMIGDAVTDVEAGQQAGCRTILVGRTAEHCKPDFIAKDMKALAELLKKHL